MNKAVEREINKIYWEVYKKVFNKASIDTLSTGSSSLAKSRLIALQSSDQYEEFAKKFAQALAKKGLATERGVWRKFFKAAKSKKIIALPMTYKAFELRQIGLAAKHNFEMIKSIPSRIMEILGHKYLSTLIEEVAKGTLPRGSFKKELEKHAGKQAKVIARTETAKLQAAILENRSTDLGSVAYFWRSSRDIRTRTSHRAMNWVVVFWRQGQQKPHLDDMYGNAGEFPNCRCTAFPIYDEDDLNKPDAIKDGKFRVYNYNTEEIIQMTRKELIIALKENSL